MLIFTIPASAEFYQYVDSKGITHYTDKIATIPAKYQSQLQKRHKRNTLPEELPYPEYTEIDLIESPGQSIDQSITDTTFYSGAGLTKKSADRKSKIPRIEELKLEKGRLLVQQKTLNQKFETLIAEKQQIESNKENMKDQKSISIYNQNVKKLNKKIQLFKKEENRFKTEIERYNESIAPLLTAE